MTEISYKRHRFPAEIIQHDEYEQNGELGRRDQNKSIETR
jgi:hypothetical protein